MTTRAQVAEHVHRMFRMSDNTWGSGCGFSPDDWQTIYEALSAPVPCAGEKEGWKLVPVDPTREMCPREQDEHGYRYALSCAPSPPRQGVEREKIAQPIKREQIVRAFLFETSIFDSQAEIDANPEHRLVGAANKAADRIIALLQPDGAAK